MTLLSFADEWIGRKPNPEWALQKYRRGAAHYEAAAHMEATRQYVVARLNLRAGDTVLDLACGSGLNFAYLQQAIGPWGRLIGVELSPDMLALAGAKVEHYGWNNVTLIQAPAEEANIPGVDAVLISFAHDVMRSPAALENALAALKPGGRIVVAGPKWAPWWQWPTNFYIWRFTRRYITTFEGFACPWSLLAQYLPGLQVETILSGRGYLGKGKWFLQD
jgi:demethylmenaquinone methyltransferase/2-methoxy-6-polyprenyl-1,4-benzoquinol methylase